MFRRINITGNAGAGKSTLTSEIGTLLDMPTYGLDLILFKPDWKEPEPDERRNLLQELVAKDTWVIDGVSRIIRKEADLVIFLDVPRRTCLYRCVKRNWRYLFRSRPGLPDHCPEIMILPALLKIIWNFPITVRPEIMSEALGSQKYRHVTSNTKRESIYAELATCPHGQ